MRYSIYSIRNKINGKRYVGLTRDITSRWYHHIYELRRGLHHSSKLQRAFNKYGEDNFEFSVLETVDCDFDFIASEEIAFIQKYDSCINGYNITHGGEGTDKRVLTEETKEKLRKAMQGNTYALGKKHSEDTKKRQSEAMKHCSDIEERKLRASNILIELWNTQEFREKMQLLNKGNTYNLGKHLTEDTKLKLSVSHLGSKNPFYGKHHTEDTKRALSSSLKEKWKDENYVTKVKEALHSVMTSTDYRLKQAKLSTGRSNKTSEFDALTIRYRYICGESPISIHKDFSKLSLSGLKKICYNATWKHLPNTKDELYNKLINYHSQEKSCEGLETR